MYKRGLSLTTYPSVRVTKNGMKNDTTNKTEGRSSRGLKGGVPKTYAEDPAWWDKFWDEARARVERTKAQKVLVVVPYSLVWDLIKSIRKETKRMSEVLDRVERAAGEIVADAAVVKSVIAELRAIVEELRATQEDSERLAKIAADLEAADVEIDAATATPAPEPEPEPEPTPEG